MHLLLLCWSQNSLKTPLVCTYDFFDFAARKLASSRIRTAVALCERPVLKMETGALIRLKSCVSRRTFGLYGASKTVVCAMGNRTPGTAAVSHLSLVMILSFSVIDPNPRHHQRPESSRGRGLPRACCVPVGICHAGYCMTRFVAY